jgi:mannitol/fructose-specific phosphotransferase system IIA component (Ntr-type)
MIKSLVDSAAIVADVKAQTKEAALKELLAAAQDAGVLAKKAVTPLGKKLLEREAIGSTGFGNGVAVPHGKHDGVERPLLVLARHRSGLDWKAIDGRPVHIVFFLLSPADEPETHLQCLRWISTLARNADFRRFLLDAKDAAAMLDLLREMLPPA